MKRSLRKCLRTWMDCLTSIVHRTSQQSAAIFSSGGFGREPSMPKCTYCGGTEFYEGPSGGMSTNVLCANSNCRHWFNWTPVLEKLDDLNRVEPTEEAKVIEKASRV